MRDINIRKIIVLVLFYGIILLPLFLWLLWLFTPRKPLSVLIMDKTVLHRQCVEHRGLNWILKNKKYVKPDHKFYVIDKDYYGFFPKDSNNFEIHDLHLYNDSQIEALSRMYDMTYYADQYGIYIGEWGLQTEYTEHTPKIYGGMDWNDYLFLRKMKEKGKLIIAEFNFIHEPTPYAIRRSVEDLFHFRWTGWTGRYFDSLDTITNLELPRWVIRLYREQNNGRWPFKIDGLVFVHENNTICILENKIDMDFPVPVIKTTDYGVNKYNIPASINYPYWFDITFPSDNVNRTLSSYYVYPNTRGDSILRRYHIPSVFPAFFEYEGEYKYYYFAGDWVDSDIKQNLVYFKWSDWFQKFTYNPKKLNERVYFNWNYYEPIVKDVLSRYYDEISKKR